MEATIASGSKYPHGKREQCGEVEEENERQQ